MVVYSHKPVNIFAFYNPVRLETGLDQTCCQFGQTKMERENDMFHCNKIILEVSSELFNKGLVILVILVKLVYFYLTYT